MSRGNYVNVRALHYAKAKFFRCNNYAESKSAVTPTLNFCPRRIMGQSETPTAVCYGV